MSLRVLALISVPFVLFSCSTITKKDCDKDMYTLGLSQGRAGSPKKFTDQLSDKCLSRKPDIDLAGYEKGFYQGWMEYCLPDKAFELGKRSDRYFSFCPPEREDSFRKKYLVGKHHAELKDVEADIIDKMDDMKPHISESATNFDDYTKLQKELDKIKREIQELEVEGMKNNFKFR
jgi:hypothetical protein